MRHPAVVVLMGLFAAACAATPDGSNGPAPVAQNENDCAVIAAVARDHYRFGPDNAPPPLWLDDQDSGWAPRCDWSRYGVEFARIHDPDQPPADPQRVQWVSFKQPRYDGMVATIEAGILHGPLAGMGVECRVRSGIAGWSLDGKCRSTWIS